MIITIEGPTGAGKSQIALDIATALSTEIINCDSRQIYRYLDIGTAKPSKDDIQRVQHHLIDIINPSQSYNAGKFVTDATEAVSALKKRCVIPILCGGTGLYIRSFIDGLFIHPQIDPMIRKSLNDESEQMGIHSMYHKLLEIDPIFANKISTSDKQRILRGLEVFYATGKPISTHWAEQAKNPKQSFYRILVNSDREVLYKRIDKRFTTMMDQGLIQEIADVLKMGYSFDDPGLNSLGYKEFKAYFTEQASIDECATLATQHHRNYAKRQMTWYRKISFDLTIDPECFSLSDVLGALSEVQF